MNSLHSSVPSISTVDIHPKPDIDHPQSSIFSNDSSVLSDIRERGKNLAVWQRNFSPLLDNFLNSLCLPMPRQHKLVWQPDTDIAPILDQALLSFTKTQSEGLLAWRNDMLELLAIARALSPNSVLKIRLESVSSNGCRLFHTDNVALRLICTYRGSGTLWIPEHAIDRCCANRIDNTHVLDESAVRSLSTAWVACMKGDGYPEERNAGLFHRSPPAGTEMPRILLAVDLD